MFKVDEIKSSFDCDLCHELLTDPVVMACGKFICKSHLDKLLMSTSDEKNTFICEVCHEEHSVPKKGFIINDRLQSLLEFRFNTLKTSLIHDECKREMDESRIKISQIDLLESNSVNYIYEYFEDIKRQVDIRREDLKFKVDTYSDDLIKSLENHKMNFMKLSKEVNQITTEFEKSKTTFNDLLKRFDTLEFNEKKFEEIKSGVEVVNEGLSQIIKEHNQTLTGNKNYTFRFEELPIEDIFGRIDDSKVDF